mmetsp:Transcript_1966/g.3774  ORF Transcript_1966/g.3774 Transcript_1966/m.3774 type:complete len:524 (+) Transcript_1966:92-1663(+)|eukprot:scaffold9946_cov188-Amphora_coffeaeformis.AAC.13
MKITFGFMFALVAVPSAQAFLGAPVVVDDNRSSNDDKDNTDEYSHWYPLGEHIIAQSTATPSTGAIDHDEPTFGTAQYVEVSPDGYTLANGYLMFDKDDNFHAIQVNTYTYVDRLKHWVPMSAQKALRVEVKSENSNAEVALTSNYLAIGHVSEMPNGDWSSNVQLWFWAHRYGRGQSTCFWKPYPTIELHSSANDTYRADGVRFAMSESSSRGVRVAVVGVPLLHHNRQQQHFFWNETPIPGKVMVFELECNDDFCDEMHWKLHSEIVGTRPTFGDQVEFSSNGAILAVLGTFLRDPSSSSYRKRTTRHARSTAANLDAICLIQIYKEEEWKDGTPNWTQMGQDIVAKDKEDQLTCNLIALSADGLTVAAGIRAHSDAFPDAPTGHVRVWTFRSGEWYQKGSDLDTLVPLPSQGEYEFGTNLALSRDGNTVSVSKVSRMSFGDFSEMCIFQWNEQGNDWVVLADPYKSPEAVWSASLSENGEVLALGFPNKAAYRGAVEVFQRSKFAKRRQSPGDATQVIYH